MSVLCAAVWGGHAPRAVAAGLAVAPLSLELVAGARAAAVTVTNRDDHPWVIQAQVKRWTQVDGRNEYTADPRILATPALFRLPSNGKQVVRVGFAGGPARAGEVEQAWRLFISQVPDHQATAHNATAAAPDVGGLHFLLHLVLPVFAPPTHAVVAPRWSLVRAGGHATLRLHNAGNGHLRLIEIAVTSAAGVTIFDAHGLWYVLAGATQTWSVPVRNAKWQLPLQVHARTSETTLNADVMPGA